MVAFIYIPCSAKGTSSSEKNKLAGSGLMFCRKRRQRCNEGKFSIDFDSDGIDNGEEQNCEYQSMVSLRSASRWTNDCHEIYITKTNQQGGISVTL